MPLELRLALAEASIRSKPAAAELRWSLFQLLCVMGQWERALRQLQVFAQISPAQTRAAQAYRDLIRAERWRAKVVAGRERPGFVFEAPSWVDGLINALHLAANGEADAADSAREAALDHAPLVAAQSPPFRLEWVSDSDSRFGPVCEIITAGHYRWLTFSDITAWQVERPSTLLDLVWAPCTLTLIDGSTLRGFMPARYSGTENAQASSGERDALLLGRTTTWHETGRTGVIALGQKTWMTSAGDMSLFDLASCKFSNGMGKHEEARTGVTGRPR
ncbi:type VI secretion system accessory protein TagJ [Paraburkholderia sp. SIMBA_030]|uniref:type VI secretion system accessory protein TagJ n=1 Tax=Paraburkholderia sp. SIMBA_030 TaxID=3085773 RepID=UPI00397AA2BA